MPWTKLKNIILLILILTNLCLLGLVVSQNLQDSRQHSQTRESTIRFLSDRGVQVDEAVIPQSIDLLVQTVERDLEEEKAAAERLLQGEVETEARGGEVYRYYNSKGSVQFHSDGTFLAQLEPGVYPVGEDREADCAAALEAVSFEGILLEETEERLVFRKIWNQVPLFGQNVTVICTQGSVSEISGEHRILSHPKADLTQHTISVPTALVRFLNGVSALGDVCNRIDRIEPGYLCSASLSGSMTMTPVWQVTTDVGIYQLDTTAGTVKRAE